ncbi:MAG TPA: ADP-glyceromanno-heptose 6-epimerase [bacterium]|nr:ADP-glyceromanno-heptose 6-epimerase [bacterium]HPN31848.1 ADP-glyceromanno-heptose 6-epimerase [bacterium]
MIIVTGGAGFIGSAIIWKLNQLGETNILAVDSLGTSNKWKNLRNLKFSDYMEKDKFIEKIVNDEFHENDVDCIIHMGACSSTTETDCRYLVVNNYEYTKNLADFAVSNQIRFIYASSAATYGAGEFGYKDDENNLDKLQPLNMYGYSKQMFDLYAKRKGMLDKIVGLKFFNVFGPNEYHKGDMRSIVHKAYYQILEKGSVNLFKSYNSKYKDGEQKRDFIYIKEAVEKVIFFIEHYNANGIFNIGSGKAATWIEFVSPIFKSLKKEIKINFIEMPDYLKPKYQYFTEADMTKFNSLAKPDCVKSVIETAVLDYVSNYLVPEKYL